VNQSSIGQILGNPELLPHIVDPVARAVEFRPTTARQLREAPFIDGRTDIWTGPPVSLPFSAIDAAVNQPSGAGRYVFHMSFCGSTLLARLLDRPGKVLALKEPNCLVDLADWKAMGAGQDFESVLRFSRAMLQRPWAEGEAVLIKPSSWANNLLDELAADAAAVFVTIPRHLFVRAVLRGGTPRLAFTARLAAHLAPSVGGAGALKAAIDSTEEPLGKVARLALVAHQLQLEAFARVTDRNRLIAFEEIEAAPSEAASKAAQLLGLDLGAGELDVNVRRWTRSNAKADAPFSADARRAEDDEVERLYAALISGALAWADDAFGPPPLVG
jgi:hypothetical protein